MDVEQEDITAMMFAAKQTSIQEGMRKYKDEGKASAMKEIITLTDNDCFGETTYKKLSQEAKDKALPILMFMVLKRNGSLKTRGHGEFRVKPSALSIIYHWDGQTLCPRTDCFPLDASLQREVSSEVPCLC
jgi:hypothetical protein